VSFVGIDWSETHHDACILDVDGRVVGKRIVLAAAAGAGTSEIARRLGSPAPR